MMVEKGEEEGESGVFEECIMVVEDLEVVAFAFRINL